MTTLTKLILVTGATGQQGGAVARALMNKGQQIRVMNETPGKGSRTREGGRRSGQRRPDEPGRLAGGIAWDPIDVPGLKQKFGMPLTSFTEWIKTVDWSKS